MRKLRLAVLLIVLVILAGCPPEESACPDYFGVWRLTDGHQIVWLEISPDYKCWLDNTVEGHAAIFSTEDGEAVRCYFLRAQYDMTIIDLWPSTPNCVAHYQYFFHVEEDVYHLTFETIMTGYLYESM